MEKITFVKLDTTDREGKPLMGKNGRPYTRQTLKVESKGDRFISGFMGELTRGFSVGDEVDILITEAAAKDKEGRPYLNWSLPKKGAVSDELIKEIHEGIETLQNRMVSLILEVRSMKDNLPKKNPYPKESNETAFDEPEEEMEQPF